MSEYNFEYKCMSMKNYNSTDKALQFMVYQDYVDNGIIKIQVYIPKALQENVNYVKLLYKDHEVDFPCLTGDKEKDRKIWMQAETFNCIQEDGLSTLNTENCIYITAKTQHGSLSGTGLIGLVMKNDPEGANGVPSVENVYKFITNFERKEAISYRVLEHKGFTIFDIIYPKLCKEIRLNILATRNHKPLMNKDKEDSNYLLDDKGNRYVITLKETTRQHDGLSVRIKTSLASNHDFRLVFEDETFNNFYILSDESNSTIEDAQLKRQNKLHVVNSKKDKQHRCPYCGRFISENLDKDKTGIYTCDGERVTNSILNNNKCTIVCKNANEIYQLNNDDYMVLPDNFLKKPVLNIALAGHRKSGKTIYISSLINMEKEPGEETIYKASPFILNTILSHFDKKSGKKKLPVTEIKPKTLNFSNGCPVITDKYLDYRKIGNLDGRYAISVGQNIEKQTAGEMLEALSYNPVGFDMEKLGLVYLYDIPGEFFEDDHTAKVRTFDLANGIIALIDGDDRTNEKPFVKFKAALDKIEKLTITPERLSDIPIAIVFTKLDLKLSSHNRKEDNFNNYKNCFDENCHLVREDILSMLPKNRHYHNSELERHIDCSSYEIEHYLKSLDVDNSKTIADIKKHFKNIKFFACSALGSNSCLKSNEDDANAEVLFTPKRIRIELPIIWLMYQKGLIRK